MNNKSLHNFRDYYLINCVLEIIWYFTFIVAEREQEAKSIVAIAILPLNTVIVFYERGVLVDTTIELYNLHFKSLVWPHCSM